MNSTNVESERYSDYFNPMPDISDDTMPKKLKPDNIEGFTVAEDILVVGQTRQNLQWMYGKNRDFDAR